MDTRAEKSKPVSDVEFIELWRALQSTVRVAERLGISERAVQSRRRRMEARHNIELAINDPRFLGTGGPSERSRRISAGAAERARKYERDIPLEVTDGVVVIGSDAHYWPLIVTTAHQAFCSLVKELQPVAVILNGDILDGARISRHARIMWEQQPTLKDEVAAVQDRCAEIERAAGSAQLIRSIGNHDARFETYLSANAPDFEEMTGSTLLDYLPRWRASYAIHINPAQPGWTTVRHRPVSGGIHAAYNSTLRSGVNYVHGHLHKLQVTPWGDYRGRRFGVDTGTMAEPQGPQFTYTEAGPLNWASGFAVLTFHKGALLEPELCVVTGGTAYFRGKSI